MSSSSCFVVLNRQCLMVQERIRAIVKDKRSYTMERSDVKVQETLLKPEHTRRDSMRLSRQLSRRYPGMPLDIALREENAKLQKELEHMRVSNFLYSAILTPPFWCDGRLFRILLAVLFWLNRAKNEKELLSKWQALNLGPKLDPKNLGTTLSSGPCHFQRKMMEGSTSGPAPACILLCNMMMRWCILCAGMHGARKMRRDWALDRLHRSCCSWPGNPCRGHGRNTWRG